MHILLNSMCLKDSFVITGKINFKNYSTANIQIYTNIRINMERKFVNS
jgi:hypothetical protein